MTRILILITLTLVIANSANSQQQHFFFFPEYKEYVKSDTTCRQTILQSIWGHQYLKIKFYDSCKLAEVSCYRSQDSSLKEKGVYYNSNSLSTKNGLSREAGTDSISVSTVQYTVFKRTDIWKFYDKAGRVIKTKKYPKIVSN